MSQWKWDPTQIKHPTGPKCDGCPFRKTSVGFAPPQGYQYSVREDGVWEIYRPGGLFKSARYFFLVEALGKDEARQGMNLVGGTGAIFNRLLHKHAKLKRPEVVISNTCKCRPIKWTDDGYGQVPMRQDNGDYVNQTPSPAQVRECVSRYLDHELEAFQGDTIVGCGGVPLRVFAGGAKKISTNLGSIYERGTLVECTRCGGKGRVSTANRKCPVCANRKTEKCLSCGRWKKHTKSCPGYTRRVLGPQRLLHRDQDDSTTSSSLPRETSTSVRDNIGVSGPGGKGNRPPMQKQTMHSPRSPRGSDPTRELAPGGEKSSSSIVPQVRGGSLPLEDQEVRITKGATNTQVPEVLLGLTSGFTACEECTGEGTIPRPPKLCPQCKGDKRVPADPGNPYVSERLKEGQLFFPTYHPAFLMRQPAQEIILERLFQRIPYIRDELELSNVTEYSENPTSEEVEEVCGAKAISVDLETGGLDPDKGETEVIGITDRPEAALSCMPDDRRVFEMLSRAARQPSPLIIGQNWMQFDAWWLWKKWGLLPPVRCWDTRLAGHLLNPDTPNNMTYLSMEYATPAMRGYWKTKQNYRERLAMVCMLDIDATFRIYNGQHDMLAKRFQVKEYWDEVYPTMQVAFDMRKHGWKPNKDKLAQARGRLRVELDAGRKDLPNWGGVGTENQNEMVHAHLFNKLKLPIMYNKDTGKPSAGKDQLVALREMVLTGHKRTEHLGSQEADEAVLFIDLITHLKERSKLITFYDPEAVPADGFFHPEWNPAGTATYRFTCTSPNMMNIPKCKCEPECHGDNPQCKNARYPFGGDADDWEIMGVDYAQIEVVGFLWYANEWGVLDKVLNHGLDAHEVMATALDMPRKDAKHMSFAMVYGAEDRTIAARSGKPLHMVAEARIEYLKTFPGVADFRAFFINQARERGYVESAFGRRRYIKVRYGVGRAANQAANAPVQNIPPMIVRRAMRLLHAQLPEPARIVANEHDELILTYPKHMRDLIVTVVRDIMGSAVPELAAPQLGMAGGLRLNIDIEVGPDWGHLKPLEV